VRINYVVSLGCYSIGCRDTLLVGTTTKRKKALHNDAILRKIFPRLLLIETLFVLTADLSPVKEGGGTSHPSCG
jgi:hypothetical protein